MLKALIQRLLGPRTGLSSGEVELIGLLRANPSAPLHGHDLVLARALSGRGILRPGDDKGRFVVTEKGLSAYLGKHQSS